MLLLLLRRRRRGRDIELTTEKLGDRVFLTNSPSLFCSPLSLSLSLFLRFELFQSEEKRGDDEEKKDKREE